MGDVVWTVAAVLLACRDSVHQGLCETKPSSGEPLVEGSRYVRVASASSLALPCKLVNSSKKPLCSTILRAAMKASA